MHKTLDGTIFYVGSGIIERAARLESKRTKSTGRGKKYTALVEAHGYKYTYEILKTFYSKKDSLSFEIEMYEQLMEDGVYLTNKNKPSVVKSICAKELSKFVFYDETSPSCLRFKSSIKRIGGRIPGTVVGYRSVKGVFHCKINLKHYLVHRIILELHGIDTEGMLVDHVNGNPSDNRIENLRVCSPAENARNKKISVTSKTGIPGVYFSKNIKSWVANAIVNQTRKTQSFSIMKFGDDIAKQMAISARIALLKEAEEHGIFYSERHTGLSKYGTMQDTPNQ